VDIDRFCASAVIKRLTTAVSPKYSHLLRVETNSCSRASVAGLLDGSGIPHQFRDLDKHLLCFFATRMLGLTC